MFSELNEKMELARQGMARIHKIDSLLLQFRSELVLLKQKQSELKIILAKENLDVAKLENKSIVSLFYSIMGSLDQHIDKEQQESFAAQLKYEQAARDTEDLENRITELTEERLQYQTCESDYQRLFMQKKELLVRNKVKAAQDILARTEELNLYKIRVKETREAIGAGNRVLSSLNHVFSSLESAERWGTWDMLGGGLFVDLAKHSELDDAQSELMSTQQLLRAFTAELTDVKISSDISLQTEGFAKFADFFFDGIFADWNMQAKIGHSKDNIVQVIDQVESVISNLREMEASDQQAMSQLEAELNALVENA